MGDSDLAAAQALADVATIAILQHRVAMEAQSLNEQLHYALNSRIAIEQAKGVVAEQAGVGVDEAFRRLRNHARNHNRRLVEVAQDVVERELAAASLDPLRPSFDPVPEPPRVEHHCLGPSSSCLRARFAPGGSAGLGDRRSLSPDRGDRRGSHNGGGCGI